MLWLNNWDVKGKVTERPRQIWRRGRGINLDDFDLSSFSNWHNFLSIVIFWFLLYLRDMTSTTPDTDNRCLCRRRHSCSNDFCPWSGHLHWQWSHHENPGYTDGCRLLCCVTPASQHPPLGTRSGVSVTGCVIHHHHIQFWYLLCCGCPGLRGRQHLATPHTRSPWIPV